MVVAEEMERNYQRRERREKDTRNTLMATLKTITKTYVEGKHDGMVVLVSTCGCIWMIACKKWKAMQELEPRSSLKSLEVAGY